ncbi:unnamed protein product [Euphydryas editha]|uniref:Uncharacterized protein n=1 Tax=Euphydryas editha TaxID=104508 RepID=A0AAU9UCV3_EUPED|nr:unnamed protein product [Euphydryas editha]
MILKKNTFKIYTKTLISDHTSDGEFFIDDYSHLRLSYYQPREEQELSIDFYNNSNSSQNLLESEEDKRKVDEERRRLREYYVSQMPDLPHPSCTVASIIASASQRMNSGYGNFIYDKKIVQGTKRQDEEIDFTPNRRSTLKPNANVNMSS